RFLVASAMALTACNAVLGWDEAHESAAAALGPPENTCTYYCALIMSTCTGDNQEYLNTDVCMKMCPSFDLGVAGDVSGDSLACPIYHAMAAEMGPGVHCRHAGPLGGENCGTDPCVPFCSLTTSYCEPPTITSDKVPYTSPTDCINACKAFDYEIVGATD